MLRIEALYCFSGRKDKIEDQNQALIKKFQLQLTQQLDMLHKSVAASVTEQEQQLKDMEGDMRSFVSKKGEVKTKPYLTSMSLSYLLHIALYFPFQGY